MYRVFLLSNTLSDLPVVGELPPDLRGVYLRNGHFSGARYWLELRADSTA